MERKIGIVVPGLLLCAVAALGQTTPPALKTFTDPAHGVSFVYPATWQASRSIGFYLPSVILNETNETEAIMKVGFEGDRRPYQHSTLAGIEFVYTVAPNLSRQKCLDAADVSEDHKTDLRRIGGVAFTHGVGSGAGLGHSDDFEVWAAYRDGRCYLFEAGVHNAHSEEAVRELRKSEFERLRRRLDAVMLSVRIARR